MAGSFTSRKRLLVANSEGGDGGAQKTIDWSRSGPPTTLWVGLRNRTRDARLAGQIPLHNETSHRPLCFWWRWLEERVIWSETGVPGTVLGNCRNHSSGNLLLASLERVIGASKASKLQASDSGDVACYNERVQRPGCG